MNVLFIYTTGMSISRDKPLNTLGEMQFGISYISSMLKKHGFKTELFIASETNDKKLQRIIDDQISEFKPKLICFNSVTTEYEKITKIASYIKKRYPEIFLIIGGVHASLEPEKVIQDKFDAICIGEGEYPVLELGEQLKNGVEPSNIKNIWIKKEGKIEKNPTRPFQQNLDDLPFPDREMWLKWCKFHPNIYGEIRVLIGRGCPFGCTYCSNHAIRKLATGNYVRYRSPENIIAELKDCLDKFPKIKDCYFEVETIAFNIDWFNNLSKKLKVYNDQIENKINYRANLRIIPNVDYDKLFSLFKNANINHINIGLESGSEKIRYEVLKRYYKNSDIINAVKKAKKYGIKVSLFNLVGIPGETKKDFQETIKVNKLCQPDHLFTSIFFPYPGTILYERAREMGLFENYDELNKDMERRNAAFDLPGFSKKEIEHEFIFFQYNVYKGRKALPGLIYKTLVFYITTKPLLFRMASYILSKNSGLMLKNILRIKKEE